jgi:hypothetical protein
MNAGAARVLVSQTRTLVSGEIRRFTWPLRSYIFVPYTKKYDRLRTNKRSFAVSMYTEIVYSLCFTPYLLVYDRISPYSVMEIYDPNTKPCQTTEYDRV